MKKKEYFFHDKSIKQKYIIIKPFNRQFAWIELDLMNQIAAVGLFF